MCAFWLFFGYSPSDAKLSFEFLPSYSPWPPLLDRIPHLNFNLPACKQSFGPTGSPSSPSSRPCAYQTLLVFSTFFCLLSIGVFSIGVLSLMAVNFDRPSSLSNVFNFWLCFKLQNFISNFISRTLNWGQSFVCAFGGQTLACHGTGAERERVQRERERESRQGCSGFLTRPIRVCPMCAIDRRTNNSI